MYFLQSFLFFLAKIFFDMFLVFLLTKTPPKESVLDYKVLGYKKGLRGTFGNRQIQIKIYPKTYIEPTYGAFYLKNEVSVHGLVLLVQRS